MERRVCKPIYGGMFAVADGENRAFVLPGEHLRAIPEGLAGLEALEPAVGRVTPRCLHFGVCGGCQYQHADYEVQLGIKQQILAELLDETELGALPAITLVAGPPWGYRNRIRMRIHARPGEAVEFGYSLAASNTFLPVTMCPIAAPVLWRGIEALGGVARTEPKLRGWFAEALEVELFTDGEEKAVQVQLFLGSAGGEVQQPAAFEAFARALKANLPELTGMGAGLAPELSRRTRRGWAGARWGADGLGYVVHDREYWVRRGAFFQVNRFLVDDLVRVVLSEAGRSGALAWDLFAGVGLFSLPLAERFGQVVAVEGGAESAADLLAAARGIPALEAVRMPVLEFLRRQMTQRDRPELVVLDPPRAGLGAESSALLGRLAPPRIVYVSCDPVTLARDLKVLVSTGYEVCSVHLIDLFPQTFHMETVVRLEREGGAH